MSWDLSIFHFINQELANPILDFICIWARKPITWAPLYVGLIIFWRKNKSEQFWLLLLGALALFAIGDFTSASILKPIFGRLRPCNNPDIIMRNVVHCGSGFSFPSTHATNHFALAFFLSAFHGNKIWWLLWAFLIGFSQVYVGVHYPSDILAGAVWGTFLGWIHVRCLYIIVKKYGWNSSF